MSKYLNNESTVIYVSLTVLLTITTALEYLTYV